MRALIRLVLILVLVVGLAGLLLGYWGGYRSARGPGAADQPTGTTGTVNTERAREIGAEVGERAAQATGRAKEELSEAGITTRIKAKMALDELVRARAIDVSTSNGTVTLSGTVGSAAEKERAEQLSRETSGVTTVVNRLSVR